MPTPDEEDMKGELEDRMIGEEEKKTDVFVLFVRPERRDKTKVFGRRSNPQYLHFVPFVRHPK